MILAQVLQVAGDRLLDLDDQLTFLVQRGGVGRDLDPQPGVLLVREAALVAGVLFQPDLVATIDQVAGRGRNQGDAPFEGLGFLGYTDTHCNRLRWARKKTAVRRAGRIWVLKNRTPVHWRLAASRIRATHCKSASRGTRLVLPGRTRQPMGLRSEERRGGKRWIK